MLCPEFPDKTCYLSERSAKKAIKQLKRNRREGLGFLHAYRCGSHWHAGHGHKDGGPGKKMKW